MKLVIIMEIEAQRINEKKQSTAFLIIKFNNNGESLFISFSHFFVSQLLPLIFSLYAYQHYIKSTHVFTFFPCPDKKFSEPKKMKKEASFLSLLSRHV
jgi:hypothetical protein